MKLFLCIAYCILLGGCGKNVDPERSSTDLFNDGWLFVRSDSQPASIRPDKMEKVILPHTPRLEPLTVNNQWQGICYYAKKFMLPEALKGKLLFIRFDGAMNVADVWLNGKHLLTHTGGYLPFTVPLNSALETEAENTLLVRLDNRDNKITGPKPLRLLDFCTYGGLYRNVWLISKDSLYITDPVSRKEGGIFVHASALSEEKADLHIRTNIANFFTGNKRADSEYEIHDPSGRIVSSYREMLSIRSKEDTTLNVVCQLKRPVLWSPESPSLYTLNINVRQRNRLMDSEKVRFGIRDLKITSEGLWLNGKKRFLRGVNRHQEYPYIGYALSDEAQYRDVRKIKEAGFDYVRLSHYPQSPAFLEACDEMGVLVLDAILGWQYFGDSLFIEHALHSARELIRRDRNHPSLLAWELSINETPMPSTFTKAVNQIAREEFPYPDCYTAGWIRNAYSIYIEARQHRHDLYPSQPLLVSEYGDWEYYAQNAGFHQNNWKDLLPEERSSRQPRFSGEKRLLQQARNIQEAHNDNLKTPAFADGYWAMFDYNRGYADDIEYSGIMDITRIPKFSYYFFRSQRTTPDVLFIASYWQPGESQQVRVFGNCEEVELYVDDLLVERRKPDTDIFSSQLTHPPFTFNVSCKKPGTVKAVGFRKGKVVSEHKVTTAGKHTHLKLVVDESGIAPARNDVVFVYALICDKQGSLVHSASDSIIFHIEGAQLCSPAFLQAEAGIATALIRTGNMPGHIRISAEAKGMPQADKEIIIE